MAAEMMQQPAVLRALAGRAGEIGELTAGLCPGQLSGVVIFGRGSAGHAARYGRRLLRAATGLPVSLLSLDDPPDRGAEEGYRGHLAIAVSRTGQAPETAAALDRLQRAGAHGIAVTNDPGGPLGAVAQAVIGLAAGPELARPATKTVTAQLLALALLARALNPRAVDLGVLEAVADQVGDTLGDVPAPAAPAALSAARGVVCLAGGLLRPAAGEAALKLTETICVLAAAYPPGEFQHGHAAALGPGLAVLSFGDGREDPLLEPLRREAARRGSAWLGVSPAPDAEVGLPAGLPDYALPVVATVRGQQLALAAALLAGRDPDGAGSAVTFE